MVHPSLLPATCSLLPANANFAFALQNSVSGFAEWFAARQRRLDEIQPRWGSFSKPRCKVTNFYVHVQIKLKYPTAI